VSQDPPPGGWHRPGPGARDGAPDETAPLPTADDGDRRPPWEGPEQWARQEHWAATQQRWNEENAGAWPAPPAAPAAHPWGGEQQWPPAPPEAAAPVRRRAGAARWLGAGTAVLVVGLVGGLAGGALYDRLDDAPAATYPDVALPAPPAGTTARPAGSVAGIAAAALPSVVSLQIQGAEGEGTGSGFVLDARGFVLTNNHVVAGARPDGITVVFEDGVQVPGEVVGADASYDLAVVRVERAGLRALTMGDSAAVVVGDPVVAVGAPLGLQGTVTEGIVSALKRPVTAGEASGDVSYIQALQTDAAINPGNSGGPLLDAQGQVIGVNSAIAQLPGQASAGGSIGLGFSIPSNQARRTAEQLIQTGRAVHPVIGVSLDPAYTGAGVKVLAAAAPDGTPAVVPGGPADEAGVRPGEVILAIDGRPVTTSEELIVDIRAREPGDTVTLAVQRGGGSEDVQVTLKADG